jgi:hypothetical protein
MARYCPGYHAAGGTVRNEVERESTMKLETNCHYFFALFLCASLVWIVGPLFLTFLFDAILTPAAPGKFVPTNQVRATLSDSLTFVGVLGWAFAVVDWKVRGFPWERRGWIRKGRV